MIDREGASGRLDHRPSTITHFPTGPVRHGSERQVRPDHRRAAGRLGAGLDALADRGANVALTYHTSKEAIERTALEVERRGVRSLTVAADLSDADQAEAADRPGLR